MSFFLKVLLRTREKSFWQPFQKFFSNSWILWFSDRKRSNNSISLQKNLQMFRWTRRLPFFLTNLPNFSRQKSNNLAQRGLNPFLHSKETSRSCPSEDVERSFDNLAWIFLFNGSNFCARSPKMIWKNNFSTNFFLQFFLY